MLSVIIITKNEAANIARCLQALSWVDEIIVVDSGSVDATVAIVKQYTSKVYTHEWRGYGIQKQYALSQAHGDWVLNLDADEVVTAELQLQIKIAILDNTYDAYRIPIRMNFYDQNVRYSASPKRHVRLFKRAGACYSSDIVHEKILLPDTAKIGMMKHAIMHYCYRDLSHALAKINLYSSYTANTKKHAAPSMIRTVGAAMWMFFRCFILQRGFLDKKAGFLLAIINAEGAFYRGMKQIYKDSKVM